MMRHDYDTVTLAGSHVIGAVYDTMTLAGSLVIGGRLTICLCCPVIMHAYVSCLIMLYSCLRLCPSLYYFIMEESSSIRLSSLPLYDSPCLRHPYWAI